MAYTKQEVKNAIKVFEKPSKHIQCVHKAENGILCIQCRLGKSV